MQVINSVGLPLATISYTLYPRSSSPLVASMAAYDFFCFATSFMPLERIVLFDAA